MPFSCAALNMCRLREVNEKRQKQLDPVCYECSLCVLNWKYSDVKRPLNFRETYCLTFAVTCYVLSGPLLVKYLSSERVR